MYITLTKKRLFIILCAALSGLLIITQFFSVKAEAITLSTNAQRVEFIESLGVTLENDEFNEKTVVIPEEFSDVYLRYNNLQKQAGFDLNGYRGKQIAVYTYRTNDGKCVNLMIYKERLIGGDISEVNVGGNMTSLKGK